MLQDDCLWPHTRICKEGERHSLAVKERDRSRVSITLFFMHSIMIRSNRELKKTSYSLHIFEITLEVKCCGFACVSHVYVIVRTHRKMLNVLNENGLYQLCHALIPSNTVTYTSRGLSSNSYSGRMTIIWGLSNRWTGQQDVFVIGCCYQPLQTKCLASFFIMRRHLAWRLIPTLVQIKPAKSAPSKSVAVVLQVNPGSVSV